MTLSAHRPTSHIRDLSDPRLAPAHDSRDALARGSDKPADVRATRAGPTLPSPSALRRVPLDGLPDLLAASPGNFNDGSERHSFAPDLPHSSFKRDTGVRHLRLGSRRSPPSLSEFSFRVSHVSNCIAPNARRRVVADLLRGV